MLIMYLRSLSHDNTWPALAIWWWLVLLRCDAHMLRLSFLITSWFSDSQFCDGGVNNLCSGPESRRAPVMILTRGRIMKHFALRCQSKLIFCFSAGDISLGPNTHKTARYAYCEGDLLVLHTFSSTPEFRKKRHETIFILYTSRQL